MTKEHILNEIRRTALANGGAALGRRRFFQETGVREADWYGRYWTKWSDALREAGVEPTSKQTAYSYDFLMQKMVDLIRELGRYPIQADLRMKTRSDPEFPEPKTFSKRGKKADLAAKVLEYCRAHGDEDVALLCEPHAAAEPSETLPASSKRPEIGTVYLLRSGRHYKIGRTNAFGRRERELAIQLPERATTVHVIRTDDPTGIEAYWHRRFEQRRKGGEWFELTTEDVIAFKRRKFM